MLGPNQKITFTFLLLTLSFSVSPLHANENYQAFAKLDLPALSDTQLLSENVTIKITLNEQEPLAPANIKLSASTNIEPSASANIEPSASANIEPSASANIKPSTDINQEPLADTNQEPSADINQEPSADINQQPLATSNEKPQEKITAPSDEEIARQTKEKQKAALMQKVLLKIYRSNLLKKTYKHVVYPESSIELNEEGEVVLIVNVDRNGKVLQVDYETRASSNALNRAAKNAVKHAKPFNAAPDALVGEQFAIRMPIRFRLTN